MMSRPILLAASLILLPAALLGSPAEFELRPAEVNVGDAWRVRTSTRVEEDPRVNPRQILRTGGQYTETAAEVRYKVLAEDDDGRIQLEVKHAPQTVEARIDGELTRETHEGKTEVAWGVPSELLPGEIGPGSLLTRERTRQGDAWDVQATVVLGGLAPIPVKVRYEVSSSRTQKGKTTLRLTCDGVGAAEAADGSRVDLGIQGVLHIDPSQVDRPRKAVMVYRVKISGGEQPLVATRTTVRLETTR